MNDYTCKDNNVHMYMNGKLLHVYTDISLGHTHTHTRAHTQIHTLTLIHNTGSNVDIVGVAITIVHVHVHSFISLTDSSLTHSNLAAVLETVEVRQLWYCLDVPFSMRHKLQLRYVIDEEYRNELISWWLQSSPYALDSWKWLSGQLLYWKERSALAAIKKYVHQTPGMNVVSNY